MDVVSVIVTVRGIVRGALLVRVLEASLDELVDDVDCDENGNERARGCACVGWSRAGAWFEWGLICERDGGCGCCVLCGNDCCRAGR